MKIIFLEAVQNYGGARISTVELAERLSNKHEVFIIDFYGSCKPFIDAVIEKKIDYKIVDKRSEPYILHSNNNILSKIFNLVFYFFHWIKLNNEIKKIVKSQNPDFIVVNNAKTLSTLAFYKNKKFITLYFARGWFLNKTISKFNKLLYKKLVNRFICVSEATRHAIYSGGMAKLDQLSVVHNAINENLLPKETANLTYNTFKILHAGGFLPEKGQHVSIEIAKILKERGNNFTMILAGIIYKGEKSDKYFNNILNKIKEYDLEKEVIIVNNKSNVIPYFRACDAVIHPSSTEGLPRIVMEAMVLKKPVIANAVGGVIDYILNGYTGYIAEFNNPLDYVNHLEKLMNDKIQYQFITNNAYSLVTNTFTEEAQIKQFEKIFS